MRYNLLGKKFDKLIVVELVGKNKYNNLLWKCICECGNYKITTSTNLVSGICKSCGCIHKKGNHSTHLKSNTRIYNIWNKMISRCYNKNDSSYCNYGARGIKVYRVWTRNKTGFSNFYRWAMNNNYKEDLTIDRIDNNKGYYPKNCRWVSVKVQANNKRTNIQLNYKGKTKTISQWASEMGISYTCLQKRIKTGWNVKDALETPERKPIFER